MKVTNREKNKKIIKNLAIALILILSFIGGYFTHVLVNGSTNNTVNEILTIINNKSIVSEGTLSTDEVADYLVSSILSEDKYATYYSKEEYTKLISEASGKYQGIGISLYVDAPIVYSVVNNSPAKEQGIKKNDIILAIKLSGDAEYKEITTSNEVIDFIKKAKSEQVHDIKIQRNGETLSFLVEKKSYIASYVEYYDNNSHLYFVSENSESLQGKIEDSIEYDYLPDDTAYISFSLFEGQVVSEFSRAMQYMETRGKTKLILDMRDNGGGYMEILTEIASYLVYNKGEEKSLIALSKGESENCSYYTTKNNFNKDIKKIVVIANKNTASASECLIGAMLYYGDGNFNYDSLLLTYNSSRNDYSTYGKGIMQTTYKLSNGGAIKLTTAKIYWPNKDTCINGMGIKQKNTQNQVTDETALSRAVSILSNAG